MFKKHNPGCPCCGEDDLPLECHLVSEPTTDQDWDTVKGSGEDWTVVDGVLSLDADTEVLHKVEHPTSPYGVTKTLRFKSADGAAALILVASDATAGNALVVEIRTFATGGWLRAYRRTGTGETLFSSKHVMPTVKAGEWVTVAVCWDAARRRIFIRLPDRTSTVTLSDSPLPHGVTEFTASVAFPRFGFGARDGAVEFDSILVDAVGPIAVGEPVGYGYEPETVDCEDCPASCDLAVFWGGQTSHFPAFDATGDWEPGVWEHPQSGLGTEFTNWSVYEIDGPGRLEYRSAFHSAPYRLDVWFRGFSVGNAVRIHYDQDNYVDAWMDEGQEYDFNAWKWVTVSRVNVSINGGTANSTNIGQIETVHYLDVLVCYSGGRLFATVHALLVPEFLSKWAVRREQDVTLASTPRKVSIESVTATEEKTVKLAYMRVSRVWNTTATFCDGCAYPCVNCPDEELPGVLEADLGAPWATGPCGECADLSGRWSLPRLGSCGWGISVVTCDSGCVQNPASGQFCDPELYDHYLFAIAVSPFQTTIMGVVHFYWRVRVELYRRLWVQDPGQQPRCLCPYRRLHWVDYQSPLYPRLENTCMGVLPLTLPKLHDDQVTAGDPVCDGAFPETIILRGPS